MSNPAKLALMGRIQKDTIELLEKHDLRGWRVNFDRELHRSGTCRYELKQIVYSIQFMETANAEERLNTILHEVAHAIAGHEAAHGEQWAQVHRSLGGTGEIQSLPPAALSTHEYFLWVGTCVNCSYRNGLQEAPDGVWLCRACDVQLPPLERIFTWTLDGEPVNQEEIGVEYAKQYRTLL
jgi:predicted SprT family Zn-dependent metalloprotease